MLESVTHAKASIKYGWAALAISGCPGIDTAVIPQAPPCYIAPSSIKYEPKTKWNLNSN